jgi:hypothetical protein
MKNKYLSITVLFTLVAFSTLFFSCGKLKDLTESGKKDSDKKESSGKISGKLYFCEDYIQDKEVNVSSKFTTGRLTVMVKTDQKITDKSVELKLVKLNDDGTKETVRTIPFTIPVTDYLYFKHEDLGFSEPGDYKVTLLGKDGDPIVSGEVKIVR